MWEIPSGKLKHTLQGHESKVWSVDLHPTLPIAASGAEDRVRGFMFTCGFLRGADVRLGVQQTVRIWDLGSGTCKSVLKGHEKSVLAIRFDPYSPDTTVFTCSADRRHPR